MVRLDLYNRGLFCGAQAIQWEMDNLLARPLPSVRTINRILHRNELTHRRTGRYEPKGRKYPKLIGHKPNDVHQSDFVGPCYRSAPRESGVRRAAQWPVSLLGTGGQDTLGGPRRLGRALAVSARGRAAEASPAEAPEGTVSPHPLRSQRAHPRRVRRALSGAPGGNLRVRSRHGERRSPTLGGLPRRRADRRASLPPAVIAPGCTRTPPVALRAPSVVLAQPQSPRWKGLDSAPVVHDVLTLILVHDVLAREIYSLSALGCGPCGALLCCTNVQGSRNFFGSRNVGGKSELH